MPFGKYRGRDLEDVPTSHLHWLLENLDYMPTSLVEEMQNQLKLRWAVSPEGEGGSVSDDDKMWLVGCGGVRIVADSKLPPGEIRMVDELGRSVAAIRNLSDETVYLRNLSDETVYLTVEGESMDANEEHLKAHPEFGSDPGAAILSLQAQLTRARCDVTVLESELASVRAELRRTTEYLELRETVHAEKLLECERLRKDLQSIAQVVAKAASDDRSTDINRYTRPPEKG